MHELVSFNGAIIGAKDATIGAVSSAALYGDGVFTTVAIVDSEPFLWEKHWRRLHENSGRLGIDISAITENVVRESIEQITTANGVSAGRARITFFNESSTGQWQSDTARNTSILITTAERRTIPESLRLAISPYKINSASPLAGIKSCNYLEKFLALNEARSSGYHEAIQLNERGFVTSACMANVFWLKGNELFTTPQAAGCLAGTTREFVMEQLDCSEVECAIDELKSADAIFLSSAGMGVVEAAEFDGISYGRSGHRILELAPALR